MNVALDIFITLLAVSGLLLLGWLLLGKMLAPLGGDFSILVIPISGEGTSLEQSLDGLKWLKASGIATLSPLVVDIGLTNEGRGLAMALLSQWPQGALCTPEEATQYVTRWHHDRGPGKN